MHIASYEFLMNPKESAGCHQTLSARVGSGVETRGRYATKEILLKGDTKVERWVFLHVGEGDVLTGTLHGLGK